MHQPILQTERLILRPYRESDRAAFIALHTDPVVRRHMNGPLPLDVANARFDQYLHRKEALPVSWAITLKGDERFVGRISLFRSPVEGMRNTVRFGQVEMGYMLAQEHWGRGLATEAVGRVLAYAFDELRLPRIVADVDLDHHASRRVLEKAGFTKRSRNVDEHGEFDIYVLDAPNSHGV